MNVLFLSLFKRQGAVLHYWPMNVVKLLDTNGIRFFLQISLGLLVRKVDLSTTLKKQWIEGNVPIYRDIAFIIFIYFSLNQPCSFIERSSYSDGYFNQKGQLLDCTSCDVPNSYLHILHASCDVPNSYIHILTDKVSACDELFKCIKMSFM